MGRDRDIELFFYQHVVFTHDDFAKHISPLGKLSPRTVDSRLRYYIATGRVTRIKRGLFKSLLPGESAESCAIDPFLIASKAAMDAVLAYHSALQFHGINYSIQHEYPFLTQSRSRAFKYRNFSFKPVTFPTALSRQKQESYEVIVQERLNMDVQVTSLERTLVDTLARPDLSGGWEEIWHSFAVIDYLKHKNIIRYTLLLNNATLCARVGYYLEKNQKRLMIPLADLAPLRERKPLKPHYFDKTIRVNCQLVNEWNLIIPNTILNESWEEIL